MEMLAIHGLHKRFGDKKVLCGLDLTVPEGSIFGFIGKNGAGKTTAMMAVLGLTRPDSGEILVHGEPVRYGGTKTNRFIGYLPDVPAFYPHLTAREYLRFCGEVSGMERGEIALRSDELLALVGLGSEKHRIGGYSRGMKQRLGIAQALLSRPSLLICDEPTSALDVVGRREILDILLAVREQTTVLFSTHILSDVERICTDIALLDRGRIALRGSLSEVRSAYRTEEYAIETETRASLAAIASAFPSMREEKEGVLTFTERQCAPGEVLRFIAKQEIALVRFERTEPTLEKLFMEVTGA